jgi:4-hydroxy-3-polyprenylbenzoate decarboxylase
MDATGLGLEALPALQSWPGDGGRYLTLGQVYTRHPDGSQHNCGIYRVQVLGKDKALIRCHPGSGGALHLQAWHERNQAMPLAIVLGGPPVMTLVSATSLPDEIDELGFAEYLTGQSIDVASCQNSDLTIPATSELVIEGHINPGEEAMEGPFGNHTGSYMPRAKAPILQIDSISMRKDAIYPCTVVGKPPMENVHLATAASKLLLTLLQHDHPWVHDVFMPTEGIFHRAAFVATEATDKTAMQLSQVLWKSALLKNSRLLVLLDSETNLSQSAEVYWKVINVTDWGKNVIIDKNKLVIDARSYSRAGTVGHDQITIQKVLSRWADYGLE